MHLQRERRLAANETEERLTEPGKWGWKLLIEEHNAQLRHVDGTWRDRRSTWDYHWRNLGDTARAKMVPAWAVEDSGERILDYLLHVASEKSQARGISHLRTECGEFGAVESCLARSHGGAL